MAQLSKTKGRSRRHARIRAKVMGTLARPRLSVFKSNRDIYAQLIDDEKGMTLVSSSSRGLKGVLSKRASEAGKLLAKAAISKKIEQVVFDRGGYRYTGVVEALAQGAREEGLSF